MKTTRSQDWPTRRFAWLAISVLLAAGVPYLPLEYLSSGMAMLGWGFLVLLLPVAAFRPDARFYLKGDCTRRAKTFAFVLGANLAVFVLVLATMVAAWG